MDLFTIPRLTREDFASRALSLVPVVGDGFAPDLRSDWDYVLAAPVKGFLYEGIYVVEMLGFPCLKRCQRKSTGQIAMMNDNPAYGATPAERTNLVPGDWFAEHVLGIVVCDLKVRDPKLMREAWEGSR